MQPWIIKHQPKKISELNIQVEGVSQLKKFISDFGRGKKAAFVYGPTGCGKSSAAYVLASEFNYEVVELNASDFRNQDQINLIIGNAMTQRSLFAKGKIILVDEVDGLSATKDRGGITTIARLIDKSSYPIVLIADNPWHKKFSSLRSKAQLIEFKALKHNEILRVLKRICDAEKIKYSEENLRILARRAGGDLRAAVNDLQIVSQDRKISKDALDELVQRKQKESIISALLKIFKTKDVDIAITAFDDVDEDIDKRFLWLSENIAKEYTNPKDLGGAYDMLSKADVYKGRIRRWQYWRFLSYINTLMTAGIALAKERKYKKFTAYKPTTRLLKLWHAKMRYQKRNAIALKIARHVHSSSKRVLNDVMPYISIIFKKNNKIAKNLAKQLDLDKDEIAWLSR